MQATEGGAIKIGYSEDVPRRRVQLEGLYKKPLAILAVRDGDQDEEARIHAMFSHLRLGKTEQFKPAPDLLAFIGQPLLVGMNPDAVEAMPFEGKPLIALKCRQAYKDWVAAFAKSRRTTPSQLLDQALVLLAEHEEYEAPPER